MKVAVYSCITGGYDKIESTLAAGLALPEKDVDYYLFTDQRRADFQTPTQVQWRVLPLRFQHKLCRRRTARWHKLHSHELFPDYDATMWLDGSQRLKGVSMLTQVDAATQSATLATFKHPDRTCVYQELAACIRLRKDNAELMRRQIQRYRAEGYPAFNGLVETACVIRRNLPEVTEFNRLWWAELLGGSLRDQLSFNYVAWKRDFKYSIIPGCREKSGLFDFVSH